MDDTEWVSENQASNMLGHPRFNAGAWGKFIGYLEPAYNSQGAYGVTRESVQREVAFRAGKPSPVARAIRVARGFAEFITP